MKRPALSRISSLVAGALLLPVPVFTPGDALPGEATLSDDCPEHHQHEANAAYALSAQEADASSLPGVEHVASEAPAAYALAQNYPNPFNATTTISFTLVEAGFVELRVYNVVGQEVATLVRGPLPAGTHRVTWEAHRLSSGTYQYVLQAGAFLQARRMVLVK